jgi:hypothetical protein
MTDATAQREARQNTAHSLQSKTSTNEIPNKKKKPIPLHTATKSHPAQEKKPY